MIPLHSPDASSKGSCSSRCLVGEGGADSQPAACRWGLHVYFLQNGGVATALPEGRGADVVEWRRLHNQCRLRFKACFRFDCSTHAWLHVAGIICKPMHDNISLLSGKRRLLTAVAVKMAHVLTCTSGDTPRVLVFNDDRSMSVLGTYMASLARALATTLW